MIYSPVSEDLLSLYPSSSIYYLDNCGKALSFLVPCFSILKVGIILTGINIIGLLGRLNELIHILKAVLDGKWVRGWMK